MQHHILLNLKTRLFLQVKKSKNIPINLKFLIFKIYFNEFHLQIQVYAQKFVKLIPRAFNPKFGQQYYFKLEKECYLLFILNEFQQKWLLAVWGHNQWFI